MKKNINDDDETKEEKKTVKEVSKLRRTLLDLQGKVLREKSDYDECVYVRMVQIQNLLENLPLSWTSQGVPSDAANTKDILFKRYEGPNSGFRKKILDVCKKNLFDLCKDTLRDWLGDKGSNSGFRQTILDLCRVKRVGGDLMRSWPY